MVATDADLCVLSVDNKDHRLAGPAMSLGARYFDADGALTLPDDDGLRAFLLMLNRLMEQGVTPADTLLGTGKSQDYFVRGETAMYICGSWKVEEVAAQVGDAFEWAIVPNPAGRWRGHGRCASDRAGGAGGYGASGSDGGGLRLSVAGGSRRRVCRAHAHHTGAGGLGGRAELITGRMTTWSPPR